MLWCKRCLAAEAGKMNHRQTIAALGVVSLVVAACGTGTQGASTTSAAAATTTASTITSTSTTMSTAPTTTIAPTTTEPATTTTPTGNRTVAYFLLEDLDPETGGPFLVPAYREADAADDPVVASLQSLLSGPTPEEVAGTPSLSTAIPEGAELLSVAVTDGVATVDLSEEFDDGGGSFSMFARLAQVVFTLTRSPNVDEIIFHLAGEPVTVFSSEGIELHGPQQRDNYYDLLPSVFVDEPAWGQIVTSPFEVRGISNVFEATSQLLVTDDDGLPLHEETMTATSGTGDWGEWQATVSYTVDRAQVGAVIVWTDSPENGSRTHVREYPVRLR